MNKSKIRKFTGMGLEMNMVPYRYKVRWYEAMEAVEKLGDGWRMPTVNEFLFLNTLDPSLGILPATGSFWTSEKIDTNKTISTSGDDAYYWDADFSLKNWGPTRSAYYGVLLVRDI